MFPMVLSNAVSDVAFDLDHLWCNNQVSPSERVYDEILVLLPCYLTSAPHPRGCHHMAHLKKKSVLHQDSGRGLEQLSATALEVGTGLATTSRVQVNRVTASQARAQT